MHNDVYNIASNIIMICLFACCSCYSLVSVYIGMWHHADHMLERSYCLNKLAYGLPLQ